MVDLQHWEENSVPAYTNPLALQNSMHNSIVLVVELSYVGPVSVRPISLDFWSVMKKALQVDNTLIATKRGPGARQSWYYSISLPYVGYPLNCGRSKGGRKLGILSSANGGKAQQHTEEKTTSAFNAVVRYLEAIDRIC